MGRIFAVLLILVAVVVCVGLYLGWFHFSTGSEGEKTNVTITVDKEKFHQDEEKAKKRIQEAGQKVKDAVGAGN